MKTQSKFQGSKSMPKLLMTALCGVVLSLTTASAVAQTLWTGSGPGTFTVLSDGSVHNPQCQYSLIGDTHSDRTWDFHTTADTTGIVTLPYCWRGFHAFFQVTAHLQAYVIHNGVTTTTQLVDDGPVDCCTPPSGGFHYSGSVDLSVQAGDQYGFLFGGQNFDENQTMQGTFAVVTIENPCPLGQGFWKNHPEAWPVSSLTLGTVTYTQAQLLAILNMTTKGDASLILATQLIAAKLSIANGSDPCPIESTVAAADALIGARTIPIVPTIKPSRGDGPQMVSLGDALRHYNLGELTPGCTP